MDVHRKKIYLDSPCYATYIVQILGIIIASGMSSYHSVIRLNDQITYVASDK